MGEAAEPARLEAVTEGGVTRVAFPRAKLDGVAVRELYELAIALTDAAHPRLVVDLTGLPMVSSGAVGMFISIRKKYLQHGGQLHLAGADPLVRESLEVMQVHRMIRLFDTPAEAVAAFK